MMRAAHRVVVVGPTYQRLMSKAWNRPDVVWAPNVADIELFSNGNSELGPVRWLKGGERRILFVGRLSAPKGIWDLLDAACIVLRQHPNAKFVLVGVAESEADEKALRRAVQERSMQENVIFLGALTGREKARAFLTSDMLVIPSWTEAFPLVIPEAMAAGIPIVATGVGAIPDFVADGKDGFLVPARDPGALSDRICCLLNDDVIRRSIGERVRSRAAVEFGIDVGCGQVAAIIRSLIQR